MAELPQIAVDAFLIDANGNRAPLGRIDFTEDFAERIARFPHELERMLGGPGHGDRSGIFFADVANALPMEARAAARDGRISLPGLREALEVVAQQIEGDFSGLLAACRAVRDARWRLEDAEREQARVASARWQADISGFEMYYGTQFPDDFVSCLTDAAETWGWDAYLEIDPHPGAWEGPEFDAWEGRHRAWVRASMPPYAWGTATVPWDGVSLEAVRAAAEDGEVPDVEAIIEADMQDHHEDAADKIVGVDALQAAVKAWMAAGGLDGGGDAALEVALSEWNARQAITSFNADMSVAVPVFADVTREEALAFAEARVAKAKAALEAARCNWKPRGPSAERTGEAAAPDTVAP